MNTQQLYDFFIYSDRFFNYKINKNDNCYEFIFNNKLNSNDKSEFLNLLNDIDLLNNNFLNYDEENLNLINDQNEDKKEEAFKTTFETKTIDNTNKICSNSREIKPTHVDSFKILDTIDKINDRALTFKMRTLKPHYGDIWLKVAIWNVQSLNKKLKQRYCKLEFLRDFFNENKFDILWLIDVNDTDSILLNGFRKFTDKRSVLFVKDTIESEFVISRNLIFSEEMKFAFIYITPNSNDLILINNFKVLLNKKFTIFGDINLKSNSSLVKNIPHFIGEDTMQTGVVSNKNVKVFSFAAPSDHRLIAAEVKTYCKFNNSLRITKLSYTETKKNIYDLASGKIPNFKPVVKITQSYFSLNDRENTINAMMNDYLKNNVSKIYKRYNYLWKYDRREPFLGKKVNDGVRNTYAQHLKEDINKTYIICNNINLSKKFYDNMAIKPTFSHAINDDFISLENITKAMDAFINDKNTDNSKLLNNLINVMNKINNALNAETFFLQKNKTVNTFADVRVIIIIPTLIKIFESVVYYPVSEAISNFFNNNGTKYQFGAVKHGSTYNAMIDLRLKMNNFKNHGVLFLDIAKGYDNVDHNTLIKCFSQINDPDIQQILITWANAVYNMDILVNNTKIKKTRGIAMGLSLSPLAFILYVHYILKKFDKKHIVMYIDDLAYVLDPNKTPEENLELVLSLLETLEKAGLPINKKKTVILTANEDVKRTFSISFTIVNKECYLGRTLGLNGDGMIINDDRFYNINGFRSMAVPYWANFFVKRIIGINALDAKLRFRMMMWATKDIFIRTSIWRHTWSYFKTGMGIYSYTQLAHSCFNIFRYFIDPVDVMNWFNNVKNINIDVIKNEIKNCLYVREKSNEDKGMIKINNAINNIEIDLNVIHNFNDNPFENTKIFLNDLWKKFCKNLLNDYIESKKNEGIDIYENINILVKSKIFNHSGLIQKIAFGHNSMNKKLKVKEIFTLIVLTNLQEAVKSSLKTNKIIGIDDIFEDKGLVNYLNFPNNDNNAFFAIINTELKKFWPLLNDIIFIYKRAHFKSNSFKEIEKKLKHTPYFAFVDGSCIKSGNKKVGAGGILINQISKNEEKFSFSVSEKGYKDLENVGGELVATLTAIDIAIANNWPSILICFDYMGIEGYGNGRWHSDNIYINKYRNEVKNKRKKIDIEFLKVPAHAGLEFNEIADKLAKSAIDLNLGIDFVPNNKILSQEEINFYKNLYKEIFKLLVITEMIYLNNSLNDLDLEDLLLNAKVKKFNLSEFLDKQVHIMEEMDVDPLLLSYNDILLE